MFGVSVLNPSQGVMVNLELSAMEADGRGKVLSSPRIVTGDQQKAVIGGHPDSIPLVQRS